MNYVEVREIWIGKEPRRLSIVRGIMKDVTLTWLLEGGLRRIYDITKGILFMETREQIRIPAIIFEKLKSDVKEALFKESIYYPTEEGDPRGY